MRYNKLDFVSLIRRWTLGRTTMHERNYLHRYVGIALPWPPLGKLV